MGAVLVAALSLAACGTSGPEPASTACARSSGKVTLSFWSWVPGMDKAVDMWNAENPDIRVELNAVAGGNQGTYQNMFNALKANTEPDLAQVEFDMLPSFRLQQGLRDISKCLEPDAGDRFIGFAWDQATFGGEGVFAIPQDTGPMAMFYRKDLFERYGIQVPKTWDEFRVAAEEVHRKDPSVYLTSFPQRDVGWFEGLAWQHGASWFNTEGSTWQVSVGDRPTTEVADYWQDLLARHLVTPLQGFSTPWTKALADGKVLTWISAVWGNSTLSTNVPSTTGKWAVAPMPQWSGNGPSAANWGGSTTAVLRGSEHPYEAAKFALWLNTDPKSLELLNRSGGLYPATKDGIELPFLKKPVEFYGGQHIFDVFAEAAGQVKGGFAWGPTMTQTNAALADGFGKALAGDATLTDALAAADRETQTAMRLQALEVKIR
ncbi:MAG: extracellular solute-binding protein [Candidatus Nanopelagicales bacterium]|jgi:multiple sugar transport system substrate-binding protein|nr:extracellular solute-binding protein [Gordonia sp. (in: high G+C Gram-positive bacteria)]HOA59069.1 extracellular solute-binding protein [Dermatophilaceae bacterium]HPZ69807.1 extracellular solute-binding protein [Dermatophilaceae bacterium]